MAGGAQQLGQPARPAQLGDDAEHAAQLAAERLDPRGRPRVDDHLGVGVGRAPLGLVQRPDAGPALDAHDGSRVARRQRADVGHLGDDGDLAAAGVQQDAGLARAPRGGDRRAQLLGAEGEGDDGAREDDRGDRGDRQAGRRRAWRSSGWRNRSCHRRVSTCSYEVDRIDS